MTTVYQLTRIGDTHTISSTVTPPATSFPLMWGGGIPLKSWGFFAAGGIGVQSVYWDGVKFTYQQHPELFGHGSSFGDAPHPVRYLIEGSGQPNDTAISIAHIDADTGAVTRRSHDVRAYLPDWFPSAGVQHDIQGNLVKLRTYGNSPGQTYTILQTDPTCGISFVANLNPFFETWWEPFDRWSDWTGPSWSYDSTTNTSTAVFQNIRTGATAPVNFPFQGPHADAGDGLSDISAPYPSGVFHQAGAGWPPEDCARFNPDGWADGVLSPLIAYTGSFGSLTEAARINWPKTGPETGGAMVTAGALYTGDVEVRDLDLERVGYASYRNTTNGRFEVYFPTLDVSLVGYTDPGSAFNSDIGVTILPGFGGAMDDVVVTTTQWGAWAPLHPTGNAAGTRRNFE